MKTVEELALEAGLIAIDEANSARGRRWAPEIPYEDDTGYARKIIEHFAALVRAQAMEEAARIAVQAAVSPLGGPVASYLDAKQAAINFSSCRAHEIAAALRKAAKERGNA